MTSFGETVYRPQKPEISMSTPPGSLPPTKGTAIGVLIERLSEATHAPIDSPRLLLVLIKFRDFGHYRRLVIFLVLITFFLFASAINFGYRSIGHHRRTSYISKSLL